MDGRVVVLVKYPRCPECGSKEMIRNGTRISGRRRVQRYQCNDCGRTTMKPKGG